MNEACEDRFVGRSIRRREDLRLVAGRGRYVDDVAVTNLLHAVFVRSDIARGRIISVGVEAALALDGVVAVITGAELAAVSGPVNTTSAGPGGPATGPMAVDDVRFVGDPIALVVAESRALAEDAADLVDVVIESDVPLVTIDAALAPGAALVHRDLASNIAAAMPVAINEPLDQALASAAQTVTRTFRLARCTNVPMEGRAIIAFYDRHPGESCTIWTSTQSPHEIRAFGGRVAGVPSSRVHVKAHDVGGGFGQKMYPSREEGAVIAASRLLGAPIKWVEDRRENLIAANQARCDEATLTMGVSGDGRIAATRVEMRHDVGSYPVGSPGAAATMASVCGNGPYAIPAFGLSAVSSYTNTCGKAAYRGPWAIETIAREQMIDHVARAVGMDPVELRRVNMIRPEDLPYRLPSGMQIDSPSCLEVMDGALRQLGLAEFRAAQAAARQQGRYLGVGVSVCIEPSAVGHGYWATEQADIRIDPSGQVTVHMGTGNHGQGLETTVPQVVADALGCPIDSVTLIQGDTDATPFGPGTGGSRSAVILGGAAVGAAAQLRTKLCALAAHLLEAAPEDMEVADAVVSVRGTPSANLTFAQLARTAYFEATRLPAGMEPGMTASTRFTPASPFTWSNTCHIATCEVDVQTGMVQLLRFIVAEDCGVMINPMVVEGQIIGGVAQGIGNALFEHMSYDGDGNPQATTFLDYLIPTAGDLPSLEFVHLETPSANPGGFRGMAEGSAIASPAAVANAVADALAPFGVELTEFPLTPDRILTALSSRNS